ncbi:helix-turn-helix domain-containing protein [Corynebacterium marinum]|uniref:helix-turn-helix domain-containing protein n=1 Tax=Corynebacterium marinum TaxID=349751 RepID=UPI003CC7FCA9
MSLSVAAEHFSVSEKTLRRMVARAEIPARRLGRGPRAAIRLKLSEVEAATYPMGSATK